MPRADQRTWRKVEDEVYSDFDISFEKNPVTGSLVRVTNDEAVRQSVRNIIMTVVGEWPYHPNLGSKIYRLLFDPIDSITSRLIEDAIRSALRRETRIDLRLVSVRESYQEDGYDVTIVYSILNRTDPVEFKYFLKRVR